MSDRQTSAEFWETHYAKLTRPSGGRPSKTLMRFTDGLPRGNALDLGCARGDDAIWLAKQGWTATGVDVAEAALVAARAAAQQAGVADRTRFERHDLAETFPHGHFDLITAMFLHTPTDFARSEALKRAADAVSPGGLLLIVAHGSRAPWSWADKDFVFPTAQKELDDLDLDLTGWHQRFVGAIERQANGPDGEIAEVIDTVVALEKLQDPRR